ncbi:MAG TPA: FAD-binding oxidoreductase [Candidatus Krumholzibacteria bacterium]|nr:FAD-binding oxidoreductase [Candidatus Krumholzibacteria bacterium]
MNVRVLREKFALRLQAALGEDAVELASSRISPSGLEGFRLAARMLHEEKVPWQPVGFGAAEMGWVALSTERFTGLIDLYREDFVARVAAGSSLASVQTGLAEDSMRFPATTSRPEETSLGALFGSGSRGWRSGPNQGLRESSLGLTAVDGAGRVLKGGGRVVKNVAGYDLVRLHYGARGAFGLITDLTIKLSPLPESAAAFGLAAGFEEAKRKLVDLRLPRAVLEPVSQLWIDVGEGHPSGLPAKGVLVLAAEGGAESVSRWGANVGESAFAVELDACMASFQNEEQWRGALLSPLGLIENGWPDFAARWRQRGLNVALVLDFASGRAEVFLTGDDFRLLGAVTELARESATGDGVLHPLGKKRIVGPAEIPPPRAELEQRLKAAFDPESLLPQVPVELGGGK